MLKCGSGYKIGDDTDLHALPYMLSVGVLLAEVSLNTFLYRIKTIANNSVQNV